MNSLKKSEVAASFSREEIPCILIVENDKVILNSMTHTLEHRGYQ